ncbi:MAG: metallophosphoesterase [Candidatus Thermoplasmatota archaeon]|nr:metallophosphoesterase [Candidatus Thermoplasmatota archaeon]
MLDEPALIVGDFLVVSDLHIGIENEFNEKGISIPDQTEKLLARLISLSRREKVKKLIILGDVKHLVPRTVFHERVALINFFGGLKQSFKRIILTQGNHDVLLPELGIEMYPSTGVRIEDCGFFHGHAYPGAEVMKASRWFMGHEHASIELRDSYGVRSVEPCWLRITKEVKDEREEKKTITVMPPFNPLLSGGIGERFLSPVLRDVKDSDVEVYLLDGTYLGSLQIIRRRYARTA